ncbi:MAG: tol-pal system YbgF family protein [Phycisphaerae bacterium]
MPDGRTLSKQVTTLQWITVSPGRDEAADSLNRAERAWGREQYGKAAALYQSVRREAGLRWMRDFALTRLAMVHDRTGAFEKALRAYLALAPRRPILARDVIPRTLPAPGTTAAAAALTAIAAAERQSQPADVRVTLRRLRERIRRGDGPSRRAARRTRSAGGGSGGTSRRSASRPASPRVAVRRAIAASDLAKARRLLAAGRKKARKSEQAAWEVVAAELSFAEKDYPRAGLAAMRVVVVHPDSPHVAGALYWAGRSYEAMKRPAKAAELYEECLAQKTVDKLLGEQARQRIEAIKKAATGG